jgi:L-lactate dehydrogenase complex protein LldF
VLAGYKEHKDITQICSLCGACNDVCPVKIPLREFIMEHRRVIAEDEKLTGWIDNAAFSQYGRVIGNPTFYRAVSKLAPLFNFAPRFGPLKKWTETREAPRIPKERFRDWFARRVKKEANDGHA